MKSRENGRSFDKVRGFFTSRMLLVAATVLVCAGILFIALISLSPYIANPVVDLRGDVDWGYLNTGLDRIHSFRDTARWWTGTWCGEVPFWRPLTSYVFLAMRLLWPPEHMLPRQIILVILHLCFTAQAGVLLWKLTRRPWLILLSMYLFAGWRPYLAGQPQAYVLPVNDLLLDPKNISDPLVGIAIMASLIFLARGRWVPALIAAAASVGFKENGFTTWPLAVLMLGWIHRDRVLTAGGLKFVTESVKRNRLPITVWMLVLISLVVIHFVAVGIGFREGSNEFWSWRLAVFFGWPPLSNLLLFDRSAAFMASFLFAAVLVTKRARILVKFLAVLMGIAAGITVDALLQSTSWAVSATRILALGGSLHNTLVCILWLTIVWFARYDWKCIGFALLMAVTAAAPSWMAAQTWAHARYVSSVFLEMAVAAVIIQNARTVYAGFAKRFVHDPSSAG
jgi:hypothetical protein